MSSGPTLTGGETYITATQKIYLNIDFSRSDWCTYKGTCRIGDTLPTTLTLCILCKYRKELNIPKILDQHHKKREEERKK